MPAGWACRREWPAWNHDPLRVIRLLIERQHDRIGDDVVEEVSPRRSWVAKIADLDGNWTRGENCKAAVARERRQVDGNVNLELRQEVRDIPVGSVSNVQEAIECVGEVRPHFAAVIDARRD